MLPNSTFQHLQVPPRTATSPVEKPTPLLLHGFSGLTTRTPSSEIGAQIPKSPWFLYSSS